MFGLVEPDFAAARQFHPGDASPPLFMDFGEKLTFLRFSDTISLSSHRT